MNSQDIFKDKKRFYLEEDIPKDYLYDQYLGETKKVHALALPKTHNEVVALVQYAIDNDLKVIARGSGTGVAGAQVPIDGEELIIDMKLMNQILGLDEETFTLTVEPGVLLGEIHRYVESKGYFYPPDPASKHASIGGNVATNAGGLRAVKYGTTRDYVKEMDVVLASAESMTLGSLNIKSSSGYDLLDLFIGSEGTLGITTQIKLKVIPLPKVSYSVLMSFDDVIDATAATLVILKSGVDASEIELFEKDAVFYATELLGYSLPIENGSAYLLVEIDGNDENELNLRLQTLIDSVKKMAIETMPLLKKEEKLKANRIRDHILIGLMEYTEYEMLDEVVPINKFAELVSYIKHLSKKHDIKVLNFGHSGDGNVHTILMRENLSDAAWLLKRKALLDDLYQKVDDLGGLPSAEHGIGVVKKAYFEKMTDAPNLKYMRKIKEVFDPKNRLNPGKVL